MSNRTGRVSVITPTFNGVGFIDACVSNVVEQGSEVLEHIIVDGGSTDGTIERVQALQRDNKFLRLIRGPDQGQSDAMNKGTQAARGAYIGILNVDDAYRAGAVGAAARKLESLPGAAVVVGDCRVIDETGKLNFWNRPNNLRPQALLLGWQYAQFPCNPSAYFYHREVHDLVGGYDVGDHFAMDFDFIIKCARKVPMKYVPEHWGDFRLAPGCKTYQDERGPQRVAAIIAQNMADLGPIGRAHVRLTKARVDFHRFRHKSTRTRAAATSGQ
jgi:glycosyltransferase involved in cell wall biosynthesis